MIACERARARTTPTPALAGVLLAAWLLASQGCERHGEHNAAVCTVRPVPEELGVDSFYQKYCDADGGLPVLASDAVSDEGLTAAAALVARVLGQRPALRDPIVAAGGRITVLGEHEHLPQVPEAADAMPVGRDPDILRGLALPYDWAIAITAEENVLCWPTDDADPHRESTLLHELAHIIHLVGLRDAQREEATVPFLDEVSAAYDSAMEQGLWADTYAATNDLEYWAEGVGLYFTMPAGPKVTGQQVGVEDREGLRDYDPALFELLHWAFGDDAWYPACPKRARAPLAGRSCAEPYSGDDVVSFSLIGLEDGTSLSGMVHLPKALSQASRVGVWVRGSSDEYDLVSAFGIGVLTSGTRGFRYTVSNIPPGEYLIRMEVAAETTGFDEKDWVGSYNGTGEGDHVNVASVGSKPRCSVDVTLYTPGELSE